MRAHQEEVPVTGPQMGLGDLADLLTVETLMGVYKQLKLTRERARLRLAGACPNKPAFLEWFDQRWPEGS